MSVEKGRPLKDKFTPQKINFSNYLLTAMLMESQVSHSETGNLC